MEEMGTDIRGQILGEEENQRLDGIDKPIIMVLSCYVCETTKEWLRPREEQISTQITHFCSRPFEVVFNS